MGRFEKLVEGILSLQEVKSEKKPETAKEFRRAVMKEVETLLQNIDKNRKIVFLVNLGNEFSIGSSTVPNWEQYMKSKDASKIPWNWTSLIPSYISKQSHDSKGFQKDIPVVIFSDGQLTTSKINVKQVIPTKPSGGMEGINAPSFNDRLIVITNYTKDAYILRNINQRFDIGVPVSGDVYMGTDDRRFNKAISSKTLISLAEKEGLYEGKYVILPSSGTFFDVLNKEKEEHVVITYDAKVIPWEFLFDVDPSVGNVEEFKKAFGPDNKMWGAEKIEIVKPDIFLPIGHAKKDLQQLVGNKEYEKLVDKEACLEVGVDGFNLAMILSYSGLLKAEPTNTPLRVTRIITKDGNGYLELPLQ